MHAIGHYVLGHSPTSRVVYISSEKFTNEFINAIRDNNDFNEAYGNLSPGTVLLYEVLERLHQERSVARFQFIGHLYDYKSHWATGVAEHLSLEIFHKGAYSRTLWNIKKRALPAFEWLVDRLHPVSKRETP
jgi:hypothetical protein